MSTVRALLLLLLLALNCACRRKLLAADDDAGPPTEVAIVEPPAALDLVHTTEALRAHYPTGFEARTRNDGIELVRGRDEIVSLRVATKPGGDLASWTKGVVDVQGPTRAKYGYVETAQRPGTCLGENGVHILGTFTDEEPYARFECIFMRNGRGYWFRYEVPKRAQQRDEPLLRQILDATEILEPQSTADRVVASLRPRFKQCYQAALNKNPWVEGRAVIFTKLAPDGSVTSAEARENRGLPDEMLQCIVNVIKRATFDPPGPAGSTLNIPITYVQQSDAGRRP